MAGGLPEELWLEIFSYLEWWELDGVIPKVCTTFERIVVSTPGAHVQINCHTSEQYKRYRNVGSLRICSDINELIPDIVARCGKTLQHLAVRGGPMRWLAGEDKLHPLYRCPRLRSLTGRIVVHAIPEGNRLTRITITNTLGDDPFMELIQKTPHLREFIMHTTDGFGGPGVSDIGISRLANLTRFELHGRSYRVGDAGLRCVITKSKIRRFAIVGTFPGITSETMGHLRTRGLPLDYFELDHKLVISPMIRTVGLKLKTLRCVLFKEVIEALTDGACPRLETLDMGPALLKKREMERLAASCPGLRDISGGFFTDGMIEAIVAAYPSCTLRVRSPQQAAYARWQGYPGLSLIEA